VFGSSFQVHYSLLVINSSVALDHRLTPHAAPPAFYTVAYCLLSESTALSRVTLQWEALPRHRGGGGWKVDLSVTVAAAALGCYVIAGGRMGALHSANTSHYVNKSSIIIQV
jgi:hypothetical protein